MQNVKIFRLTSLAEVIADKTPLGWKDPMLMQATMDPASRTPKISFSPMLAFAEESAVEVDSKHYIFEYIPEKRLIDAYLDTVTKFKASRSGIVMDQPKIIV